MCSNCPADYPCLGTSGEYSAMLALPFSTSASQSLDNAGIPVVQIKHISQPVPDSVEGKCELSAQSMPSKGEFISK